MANRYANLTPSKKISEDFQNITIGFDKVQQDVDGLAGQIDDLDTLSPADRAKLDGIEEGAQVNQNAYAKVNGMEADNPSDEVTFEGGTGITVTQNPNEKKVTITATGEATPGPHGSAHLEFGSDPIPYATVTDGGLMSAADKQALDALDELPGQVEDLEQELAQHLAETVTQVFNVQTGFGGDIQAAINAANIMGGGRVYLPDGIYEVNETLTLFSNIHLDLAPNAVVDASGLPADTPLFSASGSVSDATLLTTDASIGDTVLAIASGAETAFAPGDFIRIRSENQPNESQPKDAEIHVIRSISDGAITLEDALWDDYAVADSATVEKVNFVRNINIQGGRIIGNGNDGSVCADFVFCSDVTVNDVIFEDWAKRMVRPTSSINISVSHCYFYRANQAGFGYGVTLAEGCQWVDIIGCHFIDCRHGVSGGGSSSAYGRNRFVTVQGNTMYGGMDAGIDSHSNGQYWTITGNTITTGNGSPGDGITWQGAEVVINGNMVVNAARQGILIQPNVGHVINGITVTNNVIKKPTATGIYLQLNNAVVVQGFVVSGNAIHSPGTNGIYIQIANAGAGVQDFAITGNVVQNASGRGIWVRAQSDDINWGTISGNRVNVAAGNNGIQLLAESGNTIERIAVTGNSVNGGSNGIIGSSTSNCYITGNIALGTSAGITGFAAGELGTNMTA